MQTLQPILDRWLESHPEAQLEYVHDAHTCRELGKKPRSLAFTYETFDKEGLFDVVRKNGRFVRKSFAMGHPYESGIISKRENKINFIKSNLFPMGPE